MARRERDAPARVVERWALVAGVLSLLANGFLIVLYAVALPGRPRYDWSGPANDVVGGAASLSMIPVVLALSVHLGRPRAMLALAVVAAAGMVVNAVFGVLLVVGVIDLATQAAGAIPYVLALFAWLLVVGRHAQRRGGLPVGLARAARIIGTALLIALPLAGAGLLLPARSPGQFAVLGVSIGLGGLAFLALPVWLLRLSRGVSAPMISSGATPRTR